MKKIMWLKRIFMSWSKLEKYFSGSSQNNETLIELKEELQKRNDELSKDKEELKIRNNEIESSLKIASTRLEEKDKNILSKDGEISQMQKTIAETKSLLNEKINQNRIIHGQINEKLLTINKIEKTFFATTGNKGKGELGEMQVKTILEKSGLSKDFWTENLPVGTTNVEFAIKSGEEGKWIPIDSKVLETEIDENGKIIIDKKYMSKIKTQSKEITKYLSKKNTAGYGVLVLQNDSIYLSVYNEFPEVFGELLRDYKIYIASPSSFVQMAWSISQIVDIYERVKNDEEIYGEMMSTLDSIANFANNLKEVQKRINIAMNNHFPAIENKHNNLKIRLDKTGKLKDIKKLENKKEEK